MKKVFFAILAVCALAVLPANAQVKFGIKGGLNLSKFSVSGAGETLKSSNQTGFFVGPMVDFTVPIVGIGMDGAVLYNQIATDGDTSYKSIEVPVNLKYSCGLGNTASVFFALGPQFGFTMDKEIWNNVKTKSTLVSGNIGAGVKLLGHLQAGVNYNIPFTKLVDVNGISLKTKSWQVSLAYLF